MKRFGCTMMNTANTSDATTFAPSTFSASMHTALTMDTVVMAVSVFVLLALCAGVLIATVVTLKTLKKE